MLTIATGIQSKLGRVTVAHCGQPRRQTTRETVARQPQAAELVQVVAMLERHELTLPPETETLRGLDRNSQLDRRKAAQRTSPQRGLKVARLGEAVQQSSPRRSRRVVR